jgi:hypothetical protein
MFAQKEGPVDSVDGLDVSHAKHRRRANVAGNKGGETNRNDTAFRPRPPASVHRRLLNDQRFGDGVQRLVLVDGPHRIRPGPPLQFGNGP